MIAAGARLVQLAGQSGTAGALLAALAGAGAAGARLSAWSGLATASAAAHLMHALHETQQPSAWLGGGRLARLRPRREREKELIWLMMPT